MTETEPEAYEDETFSPQTYTAAAEQLLKRVRRGARRMATEAAELRGDPERQAFRLTAEKAANRYAEVFAAQLADQQHPDRQALRAADMVARATECAGWISQRTIDGVDSYRATMQELIELGVFAFYPEEPGRWYACYRLTTS